MTASQPNLFLEVILALLAPLLMVGSITDPQLARLAAQQAIDAYKPQYPAEPAAIAQIIGLAVSSLDSLRLAMPADVSLSMKLKLRANATAMTRASQAATESMQKARLEPPMPVWEDEPEPVPTPEPEPVAAPEPEHATQSGPVAQPANLLWASRAQKLAADLHARSAAVSPAQRKADRLWASICTNVAHDLRQPATAPSGSSKAGLLRSTIMAAGTCNPAMVQLRPKVSPQGAKGDAARPGADAPRG